MFDVLRSNAIHVLPYRCAHVCQHALEGRQQCQCPNESKPIAIEVARQRGGPCGPDANHLRFAQ